MAAAEGKIAMVRLLLEEGAKLETEEHKGRTVLDMAEANEHIEVVTLPKKASDELESKCVGNEELHVALDDERIDRFGDGKATNEVS